MSKRVTVVIADDLDKKLRQKQAKLIMKDSKTHSYSSVLNDVLRKAL